MEQKTLTGENRKEFKKRTASRLRRSGKIPAVIYGHSGDHPIAVDEHEFSTKFHRVSENTIINLTVEKDQYDVLVKDYQEDILTGKITHIDFYEIERGKALRTHVPVRLEGVSPGVREGGILDHHLHELEIECLPKDLPDTVVIDISNLEIGDSVHVGDLDPPKGVQYLNADEYVIVSVSHRKAEVLEEEEVEEEEEEALAEGEAVEEASAEEEEKE